MDLHSTTSEKTWISQAAVHYVVREAEQWLHSKIETKDAK